METKEQFIKSKIDELEEKKTKYLEISERHLLFSLEYDGISKYYEKIQDKYKEDLKTLNRG